MKILLICTGNTCRSPLAEVVLRRALAEAGRSDIEVSSAGTSAWGGEPVSEGSYLVALENGLDLSTHRARRATEEMVEESDLVLTMARGHLRKLELLGGVGKTELYGQYAGWSGDEAEIGDPVGGPIEGYRAVYEQLDAMAKAIVKRLAAERPK